LKENINALNDDPKYSGLGGMELLIAADKMTREALGISESPKPLKKEEKEKKPPAKIPDHKTLSDIPPAAPNAVSSAFAQLDKLHGAAYEAALERLTEDQRARYLDSR